MHYYAIWMEYSIDQTWREAQKICFLVTMLQCDDYRIYPKYPYTLAPHQIRCTCHTGQI